ncbi:hypothetical protein A8709_10615 [Paenibacillus pectinilyticus]|uniref:DinB-like domain-containing protein n=1 Tax=Paenibacillus pectinilyticus TaxID=512399 RepID=A0A1C1A671_9BACL|nr:DinB family protein [Paenibacillus pectinilyticus]OCT16060.1 hypothetical protein A8709_10615 [Paenibacillus pectinilyticus]
MKQGRARILLRVDNVLDSLSFYIDQLGWELQELADEKGAALLRIGGVQDEAVLVSPSGESGAVERDEDPIASYLNRWLQPNHTTPPKGSLVYIGIDSVAEMETSLRAIGCRMPMQNFEEPGHIRELHVPTDDGYTMVYWEELFPSHAEIMAMYETGVSELEKAIAGLSETELSCTEKPGKWSIREHVLHLIDLELVAMHKVKFALAEPGRMYQGNAFKPDDWQSGLQYAYRPIATEVMLFRATRAHIIGLCKHLPDALERTVRTTNREETVAQLLKMMAGHANHHVRAVNRIRAKG